MADELTDSGIVERTMSTFNLDDGTKYIIRDQDAQSKIEQLQTDLEGKLDKPTNAESAGQVLSIDVDGNKVWANQYMMDGTLTPGYQYNSALNTHLFVIDLTNSTPDIGQYYFKSGTVYIRVIKDDVRLSSQNFASIKSIRIVSMSVAEGSGGISLYLAGSNGISDRYDFYLENNNLVINGDYQANTWYRKASVYSVKEVDNLLVNKLDIPTNTGAGTAGQVPVLQEDGTTLWGDMPKDIGVLTLPVSEYTGTDPYKKAIVYLNDIPLEYFNNHANSALFTLQDQKVGSYRLNYRADDGTVKQIINYTAETGFLRIWVIWENTSRNTIIKYMISPLNGNSTKQVDCTNHAASTDITTSTSYNTKYLSINNTDEYAPTDDYNPATKKYVDDTNVQADWNQNDETQSDYVKNRPFYEDIEKELVLTCNNFEYSGIASLYAAEITVREQKFEEGDTICIEVDGNQFYDTIVVYDGIPCAGQFNEIINEEYDKVEFSLSIMDDLDGIDTIYRYTLVCKLDSAENATVNVYKGIANIKQIDKKFIPDLDYLAKVDPAGTGSFSLNRKADTIIGVNSSAEGNNTTASAQSSHAEGDETIASSADQHVQGRYNIEDALNTYADIIGNGSDEGTRSNAATVDWSGNAWYAGDVYVGSTSGTNKDNGSKKLATEEYVDNSTAQSDWNETDETANSFIKNKPDPILNNTIDAGQESNGFLLGHELEDGHAAYFQAKINDTSSEILSQYMTDSSNYRTMKILNNSNTSYLFGSALKDGTKEYEMLFGRLSNAVLQCYLKDQNLSWQSYTNGSIVQSVVGDRAGNRSARIQVESDKAILRAKNGNNLIDINALADSSTLNITGGSNTISMSASDDGASITGLSTPVNDTDAVNKAYVDTATEVATDDEVVNMLIELDMLPAVQDYDGALLTDENNNILLW